LNDFVIEQIWKRMHPHVEHFWKINGFPCWTVSNLNNFQRWTNFPRLITWTDFHDEQKS
jgi:hypothetical protein